MYVEVFSTGLGFLFEEDSCVDGCWSMVIAHVKSEACVQNVVFMCVLYKCLGGLYTMRGDCKVNK